MPAFQVKLGTNDLNCVDVPLNLTHSLLGDVIVKVQLKQRGKHGEAESGEAVEDRNLLSWYQQTGRMRLMCR